MRVDAFDYELPEELIAQRPAERREDARLLVLGDASLTHTTVGALPELLPEGALVVVNDTRVRPARLLGARKYSRGRAEIFLLERLELLEGGGERWHAMGRASKKFRPGQEVDVDGLIVTVEQVGDRGILIARLEAARGERVEEVIRRVGRVPLPPYITRRDDEHDIERYQTLYARVEGAIAAPTAGLHFTGALVEALTARRIEWAALTLHVGLGTFKPVTVADLDEHEMHTEAYWVYDHVAEAIASARARGAPVVAIGTTTARALESVADPERPGHVVPGAGETDILIQPGYRFQVVDMLFTNFHLPRSTLLAMVSAFGGRERVLDAYRTAVAERYRFFSYGDAMLIQKRAEAT